MARDITRLVEQIENGYNPDFDIPAEPQVTWTDYNLLEIIRAQSIEVTELRSRIAGLELVIKGMKTRWQD